MFALQKTLLVVSSTIMFTVPTFCFNVGPAALLSTLKRGALVFNLIEY